ncbi:MAG: hypothetical protein V4465_01035, partial [Patescibacteria group bacterium]
GRESYYLAESGIEDVLYRLKNNLPVAATGQSVSVGGFSATTDTTDVSGGKIVTTTANWNGNIRKVEASVIQGSGIAFNYGMQSGNGGVSLDGGSSIIGNIYSNGPIDAISASITGTAVAADSAALSADQTNDVPTVPPSSITFRNVSASQDFAQSFALSVDAPINKFSFYIKKVGAPANATVRLITDSAGSPSTTAIPIGSAVLNASQVTTNYGWVDVVLPTSPSLIAGTTYWVVIDNGSQNASNYYMIGANTAYAAGVAKTGAYSGTWVATALDGYFKVYTGGISSYIGGASYATGFMVGTGGVGDAWATTVRGTSAQGHMYCTTGTNNNKACDTSKGSPPPQPLPFSDSNIQDWKDEGTVGGTITGNYTVGSAGATLGPKKITGNLVVNGGGTLNLTGTIWVQGNVTVTSGGSIKLPANYGSNSGTVIADGTITVSGGGSAGSGTAGSYLFVVSTSKCPNDTGCGGSSAINITGGAGAIAANAQNGDVALSGGAAINAVVGNSISITGGSTVTYNSGLASPSFQSGPSGGWDINSWKEVQ